MEWTEERPGALPILSWCARVEGAAMKQARDLAVHPRTFRHVVLMADCHPGYGMPIGGVIACRDAVIPYAVGVDIGCGMAAVRSDVLSPELPLERLRAVLSTAAGRIPLGEGHSHAAPARWERLDDLPGWFDAAAVGLARRSLGTLGGGNHFLEIQAGDDGFVWLMVHSGSRNPGYRIAGHHHAVAKRLCAARRIPLPSADLAFLETDSEEGRAYLSEMRFAMDYAAENRRRLLETFMDSFREAAGPCGFSVPVSIHHNYASEETRFGRRVWVHRKGATSASAGETGIIPGSMGTASYIVEGLGSEASFGSCSHGAGRVLGRREASRTLDPAACDRAMRGVVFDGWKRSGRGRDPDLSEAPGAYRDIRTVMEAQRDLVRPVTVLRPLGVLKG